MTIPAPIARWPEQMRLRTALEYLDMSETSFREAMEEGELPKGIKKTGGIFWRKADLDAAIYGTDADHRKHDFSIAVSGTTAIALIETTTGKGRSAGSSTSILAAPISGTWPNPHRPAGAIYSCE